MTYVLEGINAPTRATAATTMAHMAQLVREAVKQPQVWESARSLVRRLPPRAELQQTMAVRNWVKARIQFVKDPAGVQLLTTPAYMLGQIRRYNIVMADCADAAMLCASLAMAVGVRCFFVAVAFQSKAAPFTHVFAVAEPRAPGGRLAKVEMDVTRPAGVGRAQFSRYLRQAI